MASAARGPGWKQLAVVGVLSGALVIGLFALAKWIRETSDWPTEKSDNLLLVGVLVLGLIPIALVLIDALIRRGGKLSFQGVTIDLSSAGPRPVDFTINTNIGVAGETVSDSSSARILDALEKAAKSDMVVVDLEDGKAWWETRLLVLAVGAVRMGKPRSVVFVASAGGQSRLFLGWITPKALRDALFDPANPRHTVYLKSYGLALEAGEKWQEEIEKLRTMAPGSAPAVPAELTTDPWNWTWVAWNNGKANPFATEQFFAMDLGRKIEEKWRAVPYPANPDASPTEKFPHAVTITEETARSQFGDQLHRTAIEESAANDDQTASFLKDSGEFVAITRNGSYVRLARRSALLEGLVQQLLISSQGDRG